MWLQVTECRLLVATVAGKLCCSWQALASCKRLPCQACCARFLSRDRCLILDLLMFCRLLHLCELAGFGIPVTARAPCLNHTLLAAEVRKFEEVKVSKHHVTLYATPGNEPSGVLCTTQPSMSLWSASTRNPMVHTVTSKPPYWDLQCKRGRSHSHVASEDLSGASVVPFAGGDRARAVY